MHCQTLGAQPNAARLNCQTLGAQPNAARLNCQTPTIGAGR
jgi:hypothetical protein